MLLLLYLFLNCHINWKFFTNEYNYFLLIIETKPIIKSIKKLPDNFNVNVIVNKIYENRSTTNFDNEYQNDFDDNYESYDSDGSDSIYSDNSVIESSEEDFYVHKEKEEIFDDGIDTNNILNVTREKLRRNESMTLPNISGI